MFTSLFKITPRVSVSALTLGFPFLSKLALPQRKSSVDRTLGLPGAACWFPHTDLSGQLSGPFLQFHAALYSQSVPHHKEAK